MHCALLGRPVDLAKSSSQVLAANLSRHGDLGAAVCVYQYGHLVVDSWGGIADPETGHPWTRDTLSRPASSPTLTASPQNNAAASARSWLYSWRICAGLKVSTVPPP